LLFERAIGGVVLFEKTSVRGVGCVDGLDLELRRACRLNCHGDGIQWWIERDGRESVENRVCNG